MVVSLCFGGKSNMFQMVTKPSVLTPISRFDLLALAFLVCGREKTPGMPQQESTPQAHGVSSCQANRGVVLPEVQIPSSQSKRAFEHQLTCFPFQTIPPLIKNL